MKKKVFYEIMLCLVVPILVWNLTCQHIGEFYAMLLTTLPAFIYTVWMFFKKKQFNVTGIFILCSLFIWRILDILSGTAEGILWNGVYINIAYSLFWSVSIIIKKPMGMYFLMDYAHFRGYSKESIKELITEKSTFKYFEYFTLYLIIKDLEGALLRAWFIQEYGVKGFNKIIIYMTINGYIFVGLGAALVLLIEKRIKTNAIKIKKTTLTQDKV